MNRESVIKLANDVILEYPKLKDDVKMYIQLAKDAIEEGESATNEWLLAYSSILEIYEDEKNGNNENID